MSETPRRNRPLVAAHRGASALAPELTLAAFQLALDLGVDLIELDVQMTLDGEIVAFHTNRPNVLMALMNG